jgi:hypothetical protein
MRRTLAFAVALALLTPAMVAVAQTETKMPAGPPKILEIIREDSKPGKTIAHRQHEAAWTQAFIQAGNFPHSLVVSSVTGPDEDWFMTGFPTYAAVEKWTESLESNPARRKVMATYVPKESEYVASSREILADYRPDLSYRPDFKLGEYKYFSVAMVRLRPGASAVDIYKILNEARSKANLDIHGVVYEVRSGMPVGSYLAFYPIKSMAEWDQAPNEAYNAALKEGNFSEVFGKSVMNVEFRLMAFSPQMSYMPESVTKLNPSFWNQKPMMTKAESAKKSTPVAKKETEKK